VAAGGRLLGRGLLRPVRLLDVDRAGRGRCRPRAHADHDPFDVELPDGYGVAAISNDLDQPSGRVHLGRLGRQPWSPEAELDVAYGAPELSTDPPGDPTTLSGRQARVDDTETSPAVWVQEQGRWLYFGVTASDTGPHPNRRNELPAMLSIAESVSPAADLEDPTTWLAADGVFG
jgi:hypothetical protein